MIIDETSAPALAPVAIMSRTVSANADWEAVLPTTNVPKSASKPSASECTESNSSSRPCELARNRPWAYSSSASYSSSSSKSSWSEFRQNSTSCDPIAVAATTSIPAARKKRAFCSFTSSPSSSSSETSSSDRSAWRQFRPTPSTPKSAQSCVVPGLERWPLRTPSSSSTASKLDPAASKEHVRRSRRAVMRENAFNTTPAPTTTPAPRTHPRQTRAPSCTTTSSPSKEQSTDAFLAMVHLAPKCDLTTEEPSARMASSQRVECRIVTFSPSLERDPIKTGVCKSVDRGILTQTPL
mmetsp:Transcript_30080/g.101410  ORF Transcript_30080/g.101410 Transcript_30080/m.101410 type:complete len:296 (-) Transcript_30080:1046-1933(-)